MKRLSLLLLLAALFLSSCQKRQNYLNDMPTELLHPAHVYNSLFLGRPYQMEMADSLLIVAEFVNDGILSFYNIQDSTLLCRRFMVGQGPNDLMNPIQMDVDKERKQVYILQRQGGKITTYSLDSLLAGNVSPASRMELPSTDQFVKVDDGYFCTGYYEDGIANRLDEEGHVLRNFSIQPDVMSNIADRFLVYKLSQSQLAYTDGVLAFASFFMGTIDFYDLSGGQCVKLKSACFDDDGFANKVRNMKEKVQIGGDKMTYCYGATASNGEFFVLYSGCTLAEKSHVYRTYIYRFDKSGTCLARYETDNKILDFCVQGNEMYCIAEPEGQEAVIMKYLLP